MMKSALLFLFFRQADFSFFKKLLTYNLFISIMQGRKGKKFIKKMEKNITYDKTIRSIYY